MTTIRILLALVVSQSWSIFHFQMDVKNDSLHGDLKEELYMRIPLGLPSSSKNMICKLCWFLYGLKQTPKAWFDKFWSTLLSAGFRQSQYDPSPFLWKTSRGITILLVQVNGIIISGNDLDNNLHLKQSLHASFHMKDLGSSHLLSRSRS